MVTLAAPAEMPFEWVRGLYAGLRKAARKFKVSIVGGETCRAPAGVFINVALTGRVEARSCILRSGGTADDLLFVTGRLGGSRAGKHLDFTPRLREARWLVDHVRPTAMMDVSDGLGADLPRLARASKCGYELWPEAVPRTRGCSLEQALSDGEDFELLFALPPREGDHLEREWAGAFPDLPLTRIGLLNSDPIIEKEHAHGFDHFA